MSFLKPSTPTTLQHHPVGIYGRYTRWKPTIRRAPPVTPQPLGAAGNFTFKGVATGRASVPVFLAWRMRKCETKCSKNES